MIQKSEDGKVTVQVDFTEKIDELTDLSLPARARVDVHYGVTDVEGGRSHAKSSTVGDLTQDENGDYLVTFTLPTEVDSGSPMNVHSGNVVTYSREAHTDRVKRDRSRVVITVVVQELEGNNEG